MPRWRPLPEELDPQIREFISQLRGLVDRGGMSVATVADRTGYSKSSWEKYLGGRLLPPRGAAHALAEVTGTDVRHLETMWELAERAWSRAEMRHDVTMEAIRVAQAREALGEFWEEPAKGRKRGRNKGQFKERDKNTARAGDGAGTGSGGGAGAGKESANTSAKKDGAVSWPAMSSTAAPPSTTQLRTARPASGASPSANAGAGAALDDRTAMLRPHRPGAAEASAPAGPGSSARPAGPGFSPRPAGPGADGAPPPAAPRDDARNPRKVRYAALFAGAAGAFAVIAVGVLMFGLPGITDNGNATPQPAPSRSAPALPAGVKCQGDDCTGKNPEQMGCGGQNVKSSDSTFVGPSMVEVRYSKVCKAAWGRITGAAQGDELKISAGGHAESDKVGATNDAYTEMVAVDSAEEARACATLVAGTTGCTTPSGAGAQAPSSAPTAE